MCGIMGYSGISDAITPVLEGLSRLEYRGYDSAGISIRNSSSELKVFKKEGKLDNLKNLIRDKNLQAHTAIGHTRWATHGRVNDTNAHPHGNDLISIVHNGIIENAHVLREKLIANGMEFQSETDSEVFLNMLTFKVKSGVDLKTAIQTSFKEIEGNSAFVIMTYNSHVIYGIKRSAPLVCGLNQSSGDVYLSSDPYALVGFADKIVFPEDEVLCVADFRKKSHQLSFFELNGEESLRYKLQEKSMNLDVASKGGYDHFMLKEIHEQPELIKKLAAIYSSEYYQKLLGRMKDLKPSFVNIVACGTALHAGHIIKMYIEKYNHLKVATDFASEFRYKEKNFASDELGLFISQSGETADTLACQEICSASKLKTISIVNVEGSTIFRNCDENLLIHAGIEIGVASTKAFTQQVLTGLILSKAMAGKLEFDKLKTEFTLLSERVSDVLKRDAEIQELARAIYNHHGFIFTGRGAQYPIALEGALKLKEIAYVHAEGYAAGELKHGPISLIDENMVNIAIITPDLYEKTISNAQEVKARKGIIVVIGQENDSELAKIANHYVGLNYTGLTDTAPLLTNVVLQLLSYHMAKLKGTDIDKPRNLAKSVTVE